MSTPIPYHTYIKRHKQAVFLGSLLILLIGDLFFLGDYQRIASFIFLIINMLISLFFLEGKPRWVRGLIYAFVALASIRLIAFLSQNSAFFERSGEFLFLSYFITVSLILFSDLYKEKNLNTDSVYAVFSGFILMSMAFGFILTFINNLHPGSINGIGSDAPTSDYIYFGFITLMTIGYGDITPATELTKKVVVFGSLVGHFYTVFVTAIIIGKLFNNREK